MDRIVRTLVIAGGLLLFWFVGLPMLQGKSGNDGHTAASEPAMIEAPGFARDVIDPPIEGKPNPPAPEGEICTIRGNRFDAELSSRGAALRHVFLRDKQFVGTDAADVSTTPDFERWRSLRTTFRGEGADSLVKYDRFLWQLEREGDATCRFVYKEEGAVEIVKTVRAGERSFELLVTTRIKNLAAETKKLRYGIESFAFRRNSELKSGFFGRQSPFITELSCAGGKEVTRKQKDDVKEAAWIGTGIDRYAAVSNYYFAEALVPSEAAECRLQSEEWPGKDEASTGAVYRARLDHPVKELAHDEVVTYETTAFFGPKDRRVLGNAGGQGKKLSDLINLGFFSPVARVLVGILVFFHDKLTFGNWGIAIILMTVSLRLALFPLTWVALKNTIAMRRFKPELDAKLAKFEGDNQAKQMAMMQFYKEKKFNPFGGCLPTMVQMPVWFAMFTTLQTAVELYHTSFLWYKDLTAPDPFFVLPLVLGVCMIVQQRITPMTGVDPMQQKIMMYFMPVLFTGMMLFLPAALALYSLTNSLMGILQQLVVEMIAPRAPGAITVKDISPGSAGS